MPLPRTAAVAALLAALATTAAGCASPAGTGAAAPSAQFVPASTAPDPTRSAPPSAAATTPGPSPSPAAPSAGPKGAAAAHAFPVVGRSSYAHSHHDYPASDIITACGNKFVAPVTGTVLAVVRVDTWTASANLGATRGGLSVSILGTDGVRYYGSHLRMILPAIKPGVGVTAGEQLGEVGDTGDASACHLHFGISPPCQRTGDWWNQRGTVWPWPYLDSWRTGGSRSPVAEVATWQQKNGCPSKPLSDP